MKLHPSAFILCLPAQHTKHLHRARRDQDDGDGDDGEEGGNHHQHRVLVAALGDQQARGDARVACHLAQRPGHPAAAHLVGGLQSLEHAHNLRQPAGLLCGLVEAASSMSCSLRSCSALATMREGTPQPSSPATSMSGNAASARPMSSANAPTMTANITALNSRAPNTCSGVVKPDG